MEHIKKLYGKAYHLYNIEDWKYIFSIYKEKDKYNHTEEEFLAAELIDKTAMMKKMDEAIWKDNPFNEQSMHVNESVFAPCPEDEGCKVIQDFLEDDDVQDRAEINHSGGIPACHPNNDCSIIKDFIGEEDGSYDEYLRIKRDSLREIIYREDRIQELMFKMKEHMSIIKNCKEEIDTAFTKYISIQWQ